MLVDDESRTRIKRFYHKKDSYREMHSSCSENSLFSHWFSLPSPRWMIWPESRWIWFCDSITRFEGCLLGRLLPRLLLRQHGVPVKEAELSRTSTGKPYVVRTLSFLIEPPVLCPFTSFLLIYLLRVHHIWNAQLASTFRTITNM